MSAEPTFVDTNFLLHAHDASAGIKRDRAARAIRELWEMRTRLLTEDLNDGQVIEGVRVVNPLI